MNKRVKVEDLVVEVDVCLAGRQFLELNGWSVHRLTADRHAAGGNRKAHEKEEPGTPDYICVYWSSDQNAMVQVNNLSGVKSTMVPVFYWEAKRPKGKARASQEKWRRDHSEVTYVLADTVDSLRASVISIFPNIYWPCKRNRLTS